ncbi:MAG: heme exporter protein CcmD [Ilumatobacteraceae bacterium]|jgi:heme exporter protein CcmD|nr:heme exporter protein CcmD [Ilumatobacteraceae bacterium]
MEHASFIIGSYVLTFGSIGLYVAWFLRRSRSIDKFLDDKDKPWT